jgi:hypothetical protein
MSALKMMEQPSEFTAEVAEYLEGNLNKLYAPSAISANSLVNFNV